jgi:dTDP-4-dehydrorhamnose reductase
MSTNCPATRYLVTGAEGQLGSELCRLRGAQAVGVDLPEFDLTRPETIEQTLDRVRPAAVINTAAYTRVDRAEEEPELCNAVNVKGVGHLAEACEARGCALVHISTDYVFGQDDPRREPYRETDPPEPRGVYARSKLQGEQQAARCTRHLVVRTCGLYGELGPRSPGNFLHTMLRLARERERLSIVDDQHVTPSYVPHVARAIRFLVEREQGGTWHVVNGGSTTWFGFAREIFRLTGHRVELEAITTEQFGATAPRPRYSVLDTSKYGALAGAPPLPCWQEALGEYLGGQAKLFGPGPKSV